MYVSTEDPLTNATIAPVYDLCPPPGSRHPRSSDVIEMLHEKGGGAIAYMIIPILLFFAMLLIYMDEVMYLLKYNVGWQITMIKLWILASLPFMSGLCVLGLFIPRMTGTTSFLMAFYNAIVMQKFFDLVMIYFGGKKKMAATLKGQIFSGYPPPCCFLPCCPPMTMDVKTIQFLQNLIYPVSVIQPVFFFITTIFWQEELTHLKWLETFFNFCIPATTAVCVYGFVCINKASMEALKMYRIKGKFLSVQVIIFANTIQGILFKVMDLMVGFPCTFPYATVDQGNIIHLYIFTYELFAISIATRALYRRDESECHVIQPTTADNYEEVFKVEKQSPKAPVRLVSYTPSPATGHRPFDSIRSNGSQVSSVCEEVKDDVILSTGNSMPVFALASPGVTSNNSMAPLVPDSPAAIKIRV